MVSGLRLFGFRASWFAGFFETQGACMSMLVLNNDRCQRFGPEVLADFSAVGVTP